MSIEGVYKPPAHSSRLSLPKREVGATLALFALLIAGMIGYNVRATAAMGRTAMLVTLSARQRALSRRYVDEVFLSSQGFSADPEPDRAVLVQSAAALLHGGTAPSPLSGSSDTVQVPTPHDWKMIKKLTQQVALINEMVQKSDHLLMEHQSAFTYGVDLFAVRLVEAKLETVESDSTYQMATNVRSAGRHLQEVEIVLGLLVALAALGMAGLLLRTSRRQSARFRSLVENAWDVIWVAGEDLVISLVTPSSERILGYRPAQLQGRKITDFVHPDDVDLVAGQLGRLEGRPGVTVAIEARLRRHDGTWRTMAWSATNLLADPTVRGYVLNGGDVTEARQAAEDVAVARDEALVAARVKAEFLATMSHEIRTPMNAVIGLTGLLLDTGLDPEQDELASGVKVSAENLLTIINDILDFSKIEAGKVDIEETDLDVAGVAENVGRILAEAAHGKGLELLVDVHPDVPTALLGDPVRIQQVLLNLSSNAVKFTSAGEVVIRVKVLDGTAERVALRFEVIDMGIGIAAADQDRLFRPFAQADSSTTRRFGGTGLGLAISRQLVELMDGRLGLISAPSQGSTFWFDLSLRRADQESRPVAPTDLETLAGRRAIVVDDNATNRMILRQQLLSWGVEVVEAVDGFEALSLVAAAGESDQPFDLGILDLNMPGMDGIELADRLKRGEGSDTPLTLFLLSSSGERLSAAETQLRGLAGNLTKPVRQSELFDCLMTGINGRAPSIPAQAADQPDQPEAQGMILLVEDNKMNQLVASKVLAKLGYAFDVANHGGEALVAMRTKTYDAVLMDCQMPEMDGYEATVEIRRVEGDARHTPVIAMTAAAMAGDREACLTAGMDDYITKPVRPEAIAAALARWIVPTTESDDGQLGDPVPGPALLDQAQVDLLRSLDDGEGSVLREIVEEYVAGTRQGLADLVAAMERGDQHAIEQAAHSVKGASANMGATDMATLSAEIEARSRFGQIDDRVQIAARLEVEFARVCEALNALVIPV